MAKAKQTEARPLDILRLEDWKNSKTLKLELARALELPIMKKAFATLMISVMPNAAPAPTMEPGLTADMVVLRNNNLLHNRSGFNQFYRALHNLAKLADGKGGPSAPWGTLEVEDE